MRAVGWHRSELRRVRSIRYNQILYPSEAMHSRCLLTSSSHFRADSPCSSTLCPNLKKHSSLADLVSGQAQHLVSSQGVRQV